MISLWRGISGIASSADAAAVNSNPPAAVYLPRQQHHCTVCGNPTTTTGSLAGLSCKACNVPYCSMDCIKKDASNHRKVCQRCRCCGVQKEDILPRVNLGNEFLCGTCKTEYTKRMQNHVMTTTGWQRGGGPVGSKCLSVPSKTCIDDDSDLELIFAISSSEDEDEDVAQGEDREEIPPTLAVAPRKIAVLPEAIVDEKTSTSAMVTAFKAIGKDYRLIVNTGFAKAKEPKLRALIMDAWQKSEEFTLETCSMLDHLRLLLVEKKVWDEGKISLATNKLRERCAMPSFLSGLDKTLQDCEHEYEAKREELRQLESMQIPQVFSKGQIEKKQKEIEEYDKAKSRLANELKTTETAYAKLFKAFTEEDQKASKDIATLKSQVSQYAQLLTEKEKLETGLHREMERISDLKRRLAVANASAGRFKLSMDHLQKKVEKRSQAAALAERNALAAKTTATTAATKEDSTAGETTPSRTGSTLPEYLEPEDTECSICMERESTMMAGPCGHMLACNPCFARIILLHRDKVKADGNTKRKLICAICNMEVIIFFDEEMTNMGRMVNAEAVMENGELVTIEGVKIA